MVHVPAPSIAPQGTINLVTALPSGKCLPPAFCTPLLWKKKKKKSSALSLAICGRAAGGTEDGEEDVSSKGGSREPGPAECFSMLGSVSEVNSVFLTQS